MAKKMYKDFTKEEKEAYKQKRQDWLDRKKTDQETKWNKLYDEIKLLKNVPGTVFELMDSLRNGINDNKLNRCSNLVKIFGTDNPVVGTKVTIDSVTLRGSNNERMNPNETKKDFFERCKYEVSAIYTNKQLNDTVWLLRSQGYNVVKDIEKGIITLLEINKEKDFNEK